MVNKITTPPTQNKVIDKINELVDGKQDTITSSNKLSASLVSGLATVATSGSYNDLSNKPTIPTVNNATLTIQKNGSNVATFTANASSNVTANISVPNVTSIYTPAGTDAVNGVAVSNAIATKQDNLVSGTNIKTINGNSLLGSGNITIETSSTPNVDGETVSYNSSDALQAIAIKNVRDGSTLPIWHGTEYQWNHGDPTTWYYWQTSVTALWTSGGNLPSSTSWRSVAYGNGRFVAVSSDSSASAYSTDGGVTWTAGGSLPANYGWRGLAYNDGRFVATEDRYQSSAYSTDGGVKWTSGGRLPSNSWNTLVYGNDRFLAIKSYNKPAYSTDGGVTWTEGGDLPSSTNWQSVAYGDGRFVAVRYGGKESAYSTDGGVTWTAGGDLPSSINWQSVAYGDGRFVAVASYRTTSAYSTDGGVTWTSGGNLPSSTSWQSVAYGDGKFVAISNNSNNSAYSTDGGVTWQSSFLPSNNSWSSVVYGDDRFVSVKSGSTESAIFSVTYDKCYTDTSNPTTTSTVYSEPDTASSYTISSITSGAITLSNNNTYYYNQSGNVQTYDTIGNSHPEYLCFIDGVGVKMGNTMIATNTPITTTITSSSTDAQAPSAKAVYDEIGDVETALNTLNSGS